MKVSLRQGTVSDNQSPERLNFRNAHLSVAIVVIWAGLFWPTIVATVTIWLKSETFAHGFAVLPIIIWLLWRDKDQWLALKVNSSVAGAVFSLLFILLWLMGQALEISVFRQLGAFGALGAGHWMIFGSEFAKRYQFPLAYLIFAVPMGNTLIPLLQQITAEITVFMLNLSQIPVFFEGLYISIPAGRFEVAEACSGIRYLIASLAVGTLYAYLSYRRFYKQAIFVVISIIVPVLANGIRAYLIVVIAHFAGLKYATGVDHLIYGWIFFGLVILLLFFIGGFFVDKEPLTDEKIVSPTHTDYKMTPIIVVTALAMSAVAVNRNIESVMPPATPQRLILPELAQLNSPGPSQWGADFHDSFAIFSGISPQNIELYIAKYANRQTRGELVTSTNWYYDKKYWSQIARTQGESATPQGNVEYVELQLVSSLGRNRLVRYWYYVNGQFIANLAKVKLSQALLALKNSRQSVFFIAISTEYEPGEQALSQAKINLNQWIVKYPLTLIGTGQI